MKMHVGVPSGVSTNWSLSTNVTRMGRSLKLFALMAKLTMDEVMSDACGET